jgi:hypothetical protein
MEGYKGLRICHAAYLSACSLPVLPTKCGVLKSRAP